MRRITAMALVLSVVAASTASAFVDGGCLAGCYQYQNDAGQLVGSETVGCPTNTASGRKIANAAFAADCLDAS